MSLRVNEAKKPYIILLSASGILSTTSLRLLSFIILIIIAARLLPIGLGFVGKFISSYLLISSMIACLAALGWIFKFEIVSAPVLVGLSAILMVFILRLGSVAKLGFSKQEILNTDDIIALIVAIIAFVFLLRPAFPINDSVRLSQVVMSGGDNSSHIWLMKADDLNRGYALGTENKVNAYTSLKYYPQGWHFNMAFDKWLVEQISPINQTPRKILLYFYAMSAIWFAIFCFMLIRLSLYFANEIIAKTKKIKREILFKTMAVMGVVAGISGWFLGLFALGFQTEFAALNLVLLEAFLLSESMSLDDPKKRYGLIALAGLALAGANFVWLYLAPIGGILFGGFLIYNLFSKRWPSLINCIFLAGVALFALIQPYIQAKYYYGANALDERGNILGTSMYSILLLFSACSLLALWYWNNKKIWAPYLATLLALFFSLGLFIHQKQTIHELRYYYFKSTYTILAFLLIFFGAILAKFWAKLFDESYKTKNKKIIWLSVLVALFANIFFFGYWRGSYFDDYYDKKLYGIGASQAGELSNIITNNPVLGYSVISIGSCDRGDDIRTTQLAHAMAYAYPGGRQIYDGFNLYSINKETLFKSIKYFIDHSTNKYPIEIIGNDQIIDHELIAYLVDDAKYITMHEIDSTAYTEPVSQCPDRVRDIAG